MYKYNVTLLYYYYTHFTDEEIETPRGYVTCPRTPSLEVMKVHSHLIPKHILFPLYIRLLRKKYAMAINSSGSETRLPELEV